MIRMPLTQEEEDRRRIVIQWVDTQAVDITMVPMTVDHTEAHMTDMI